MHQAVFAVEDAIGPGMGPDILEVPRFAAVRYSGGVAVAQPRAALKYIAGV
jgi:hypothetical protein